MCACKCPVDHDAIWVAATVIPILEFLDKRLCFDSLRDHLSITSSKRWVGGVRKWQFLMIYRTVNHQRVKWVGLKKSKT